ncbi:AraC family transcriptional regulator [Ferrimonas sp. SCSIO 43195]|uniref:AraC family transcriptional regulator n=1 Tax=Ferrimonas sp. SCSIO 43195 TaxID=2822844 RepID=UPI002075CEC5|nr:AraC family transcriptional regulator [Ferrimonas sp. SCSIO 43195]USD36171.1 AraC family transcriptional regulator [Ferrimonas sp. SCSIO 43195]
MSDRPSVYLDNPDALSSVLSSLQLQTEVYVNGEFCGQWAVDTAGSRRIPFHLIANGRAWLHMEGQPALALQPGDLLVFPHDNHHILASSPQQPDAALVNAPLSSAAEDEPRTQLICGFFEFRNAAAWPLLDSLAPLMVVHNLGTESRLERLVALMILELKQQQPGHYAVVNQLALLMFVTLLRQQIESGQVEQGLLAALFDRHLAPALAAIHNQPTKPWTLNGLAQIAALGRSSFARRFQSLVGVSPMRYVSQWRMHCASVQLATGQCSVAHLAEQYGYQSEAAFRKAFKVVTGTTPGAVRRRRRTRSDQGATHG